MQILGGRNMSKIIKTIELPEEFIAGTAEESAYRYRGPGVNKTTLEGIDEIQYLEISPFTCVKMHGHDKQWEVYVNLSRKTAYVCLIGEKHELVNHRKERMVVMAIKGHINYSYQDLAKFFCDLGFSVRHGSLEVTN